MFNKKIIAQPSKQCKQQTSKRKTEKFTSLNRHVLLTTYGLR